MCKDDVVEGTYKISDLNPFDNDFEVDHIKSEENTNFSKQVVNIIKKDIRTYYESILKNLPEQLANYECDEKKLEEDRKKREEAIL